MNRYDVNLKCLVTLGQNLFSLEDFPVLEASLAAQGIQALIGRDILDRCLFTYNGPDATFSLAV